jgi:hypothetical protein
MGVEEEAASSFVVAMERSDMAEEANIIYISAISKRHALFTSPISQFPISNIPSLLET